MEQSFGYGLEELARRFDRSVSWASRRLALVELLPESIQQQVREGKLGAQLAMKYLVPVARVSLEDYVRMASAFVQQHCNTREAGQLYAAWREGSRVVRERILAEPELFLKTQRQVPASRPAAAGVERDRLGVAISNDCQRERKSARRSSGRECRSLRPPTLRFWPLYSAPGFVSTRQRVRHSIPRSRTTPSRPTVKPSRIGRPGRW